METVRATLNLGKKADEYEFTINRRQDIPILHIPGNHRGPDVCIADKPEQVNWLNGLSEYMTPYWDCQWKFNSVKACDDFILLLISMSSNGK